jgi:tetratricopeptide (TPR) repeat protein
MKTLTIIPILLGLLALLASIIANAGDKYTETMQKNIEALYSAKTGDEIQTLVNTFERIGDAEKTKWEPYYYAAYGNLMLAMREQGESKKDALLDRSLKSLEKVNAISPAESESAALEGFVHMIRVSVDPPSRGQQYSGMAFQAFGKALALNPENPRALVLTAQMQYGTAKFFGSSTEEACGTLGKALEKFKSYIPANPLAPQWGKGMAEGMKAQCN